MLTGLHPKRAGKIGLATSCRTGDKDVPVFGDVLAGRQPLDQVSVDLPVMAVIERGNGCFWMFEVSLLDKSVQPVVLAGGVFGVHKHAKAVLEGDFCHRLILQLNTERIGHRCHYNRTEMNISG